MQLSLPARIYTCESLSRNLLSNDIGDVTSPAWWKKVAAMPIIGATWRIRYSICRYQYRPVIDHFVLLLQVPPPSEAADLERSVDATMHVRPSFPLPIFFFFFLPLHLFLPVFVSFSSTKVFDEEKGGEGKFDKFLRASDTLSLSPNGSFDRAVVFRIRLPLFFLSMKKKKKDAFT